MSNLSTTTSMIQSAFAILAISSLKLPVLMFCANLAKYSGDGLDLIAACKESFTSLFLSFAMVLASDPGLSMSKSKTSTPKPAN